MKIKFPRITTKHETRFEMNGIEVYAPKRGEYFISFPAWFRNAIRIYAEERYNAGKRNAFSDIRKILEIK